MIPFEQRDYFTPNGVSGSWERLPIVGIDLADAAYAHDLAYHIGGGEREFEIANEALRRDILALGEGRSWPVRQLVRWVAWSRFRAVRRFGRSHFYWTPNRKPRATWFDDRRQKIYSTKCANGGRRSCDD